MYYTNIMKNMVFIITNGLFLISTLINIQIIERHGGFTLRIGTEHNLQIVIYVTRYKLRLS